MNNSIFKILFFSIFISGCYGEQFHSIEDVGNGGPCSNHYKYLKWDHDLEVAIDKRVDGNTIENIISAIDIWQPYFPYQINLNLVDKSNLKKYDISIKKPFEYTNSKWPGSTALLKNCYNQMVYASIEFEDIGEFTSREFQNVIIAHEFGHALGLRHLPKTKENKRNIMYPVPIVSASAEIDQQRLHKLYSK